MKAFECLTVAALSLFLWVQAQDSSAQELRWVEGDVLVKFTIEVTPEEGPNGEIIVGIPSVDSLNQLYGLQSMSQVYRGPLPVAKKLWRLVFAPEIDEPAVASVYSLDSFIEYAHANYLLRPAATEPNDPYWKQCWYHQPGEYMQTADAWDYTVGSEDVIISIIDIGVHWRHEDLSGIDPSQPGGNIWQNLAEDADGDGKTLDWEWDPELRRWAWVLDQGDINNRDDGYHDKTPNNYPDDLIGYDFFSNDSCPEPDSLYHGTMMAGIASAVTNNRRGTVGTTWNCKIMCCKAGSKSDYAVPLDKLTEAIYYTVFEHMHNYPGARVINISVGEHHYDYSIGWEAVREAINYAYEHGVLTVAAATNSSRKVKAYPASFDTALAVTSTGPYGDQRAWFSNFDEWVDVCAPTHTFTTLWYADEAKPDTYKHSGGTSSSAPLVCGMAALMWSYDPNWTIDDIVDRIKGTVDNVNQVNPYFQGLLGTGRVNAYQALTMVAQPRIFLQKWDISTDEGLGGDPKQAYAGALNKMVVTLQNVWEDASACEATLALEVPNPDVELLDTQSDFGPIPKHLTASNEWDPFTFNVAASAGVGDIIHFVLTIQYRDNGNNYEREDAFDIKVGLPYREFFPVHLEGAIQSSPAIADIDPDARGLEIVVGSDANNLYVIHSLDGTIFWQYETEGDVRSSPAVADLDGDQSLEIVFGSLDGYIYCLSQDGQTCKWTYNVNAPIYATPAVDDLNKDGHLEVVIASDDGENSKVYAFNYDGSPLWTSEPLISGEHPAPVLTSTAIGELDERPPWCLDVVVGTADGEMVALNGADGSILWRRDMDLGPILSAPAIGDLTRDGCLEIAFGTEEYLWALRDDGSTLSGNGYCWPYWLWVEGERVKSSPAIVDIDDDEELEVVIGTTYGPGEPEPLENGRLFIMEPNGDSIGYIWGCYDVSFAIGDINDDGAKDIVAGGLIVNQFKGLYAYRHNGSGLTGFPIYTFDRIHSSPAIGDLDSDGYIDMVVGCDNESLYVWECPYEYDSESIEWDTYRGNLHRTARSELDFPHLGSNSEFATAFNGGRKLVRVPNTDDLWVTYQVEGRVFAIHLTDGGTTWSPRYKLGRGKSPTIALDCSGNPHVVWIAPQDESDGWAIRYARFEVESADWSTHTLYSYGASDTPDFPSMVIDLADWAHLAWETLHLDGVAERRLYYGHFKTIGPPSMTPELVYQCPDQTASWSMSPCIAVDFLAAPGRPHIVYRGEGAEIHYRVKDVTWSGPDVISQPDFLSSFPFLEIWGDIMYALWAGYDPEGLCPRDEIWCRTKLVDETVWSDEYNVSMSCASSSRFPVAAAEYASWSEECSSPNWDIMLRSLPAGPPPENISETPERSMHSHINYWQTATSRSLILVWTEGDGPIYRVVVEPVPLTQPPISSHHVGTGQEEPSFYCVERDSFIQFGPEPYKQVDIGSTALVYRLPGLKPWMRYELVVTGYWEGDDEVEERFDIDGLAQRLIKLEPGVPETLKIWIPPAAYMDDNSVDVNLSLIEGDWAAIGPMTLYEFEREEGEGPGGPQITDVRPLLPEVFALSQNYPNPTIRNTTIKYQLPNKADVNLRIYNAAGRLVDELLNEKQKPGFYTATWDARDSSGGEVASGVYFYRLTAGDFTATRKMVILK